MPRTRARAATHKQHLAFSPAMPMCGVIAGEQLGRIMLISTTDTLMGFEITEYLGVVTGETVSGANFVRDVMATVTDYVGGRSGTYEEVVGRARESALEELTDRARRRGADGVVGISLDYETIGSRGAMIMVTASGTAVKLRKT